MDTDSFVFSVKTNDLDNDSQKLNDLIDFSNFNKNHERFSKKK